MAAETSQQASTNISNDTNDDNTSNKSKNRAKKRKRESSIDDDNLPDNTLEVEKNLHALAVKNNLDDASVKKILKKVVTNDHVLAFVKMREKEESVESEENIQPITRAKAKELMKASPKSAPWNLELTPINHILVKTRPEVKALIAQELPDDEDDEEYQPAHDEVQSDDEQATCSDIDSLPATPSTPKSQTKSTTMVTDGPFKVPQETVMQARRQLDLDEEATIALRTRSKLSLSETPIEHIESSFVPPDDLPHPYVDDLWNDFLNECLNPAANARNEDDDEADPEYSVAGDPDAVEEDEESLENSLIKISKKELNDLVTELFNVMPDSGFSPKLVNSSETNGNEPSAVWEGKQEPVDEDEDRSSTRLQFEKNDTLRLSMGKIEPIEENEDLADTVLNGPVSVDMREEQEEEPMDVLEPPPAIRAAIQTTDDTLKVVIENNVITEEQTLILQQQLRMHVQITTSNFLMLFVNPAHWTYAPKYKEYLETLHGMVQKQENSVAKVCNLEPALELVKSWEESVSEDTPENKKLVQFIQDEVDKSRRRSISSAAYTGEFPDEFKKVIANSSVFLYPYLLPAMPYRGVDIKRRTCYLPSEDKLIILGVDQFWSYVEANPELFPPPPIKNMRHRWGISYTVDLVCKYMFPWMGPKTLAGHISGVRKNKRTDHMIARYFKTREIPPTKHTLIPFNPELTLYEQPESEMPRIWVRYLAKSSKRFRVHMQRKRPSNFQQPEGVEILQTNTVEPQKALPIHFTQDIPCNRINLHPVKPANPDKLDVMIEPNPIENDDNNHNDDNPEQIDEPKIVIDAEHCSCCALLRKISKYKQRRITEYVKKFKVKMECPCRSIRHPQLTNRLRILLSYYKNYSKNVFWELDRRLKAARHPCVGKLGIAKDAEERSTEAKDREFVTTFLMRLSLRENKIRNTQIKRSLYTILSRFNLDEGDPLQLMEDVYKACDVDLADTYNEFLGFLNPEQADKIDKFREYFISNCMNDLIQMTEELCTDKKRKIEILKYLSSLLRNSPMSCVMCTRLMENMHAYPKLARYCFSLFPHRRKVSIVTCDKISNLTTETPIQLDNSSNKTQSINDNSPITISNKDNLNEQTILLQSVEKQDPLALENEDSIHENDQTENKENAKTLNKENDENLNEECKQENKDGVQKKEETNQENYQTQHKESDQVNKEKASMEDSVSKTNANITESQDNENESNNNSDMDENEHGKLTICDENDAISLSSDISNDGEDGEEIEPSVVVKEEESGEKVCNIIIEEELIPKREIEESTEVDPLYCSDHETPMDIEWRRDEDKIILEVLQQQLSPEERLEKSIIEIIEEKSIPQNIANVLKEKSLNVIKDRINYLLQILVMK